MTGTATMQESRPERSLGARIASEAGLWILIILTSLVPDSLQPGQFTFPDDVDVVSLVAAWLMVIVLLLRRRRPLTVFIIVLALALSTAASGHQSMGTVIAVAVAVYQIARIGRRAAAIVAAITSIVLLGTGLLAWNPELLARGISIVAVIGLATAVGDAIHSRRALVESITDRARRAEQTREQEARRRVIEERLRIARELHDAAAHQIAVINLQAGAGTAALRADRPDDAARALTSIQSSASNVLSEISALLVVLRSDDGLPEVSALPVRGLGDLPALVRSFENSGLQVTGSHVDVPPQLPGAVDVVAYKVIQEALTNAQKHGDRGAAQLEVSVVDTDLRIVVSNTVPDGTGPPTGAGGHGLTGIRERVSSVHGTIQITTEHPLFVLDVRLPLSKETAV